MVLVAAFWTPTSAKLMGSVSESPERSADASSVAVCCGWTPMCPSTSPVVIDWSTGVTRDRAPASLS